MASASVALAEDIVELAVLSEENWKEYAPAGKEADAIYGDLVLRNERIACVIAAATPARHANLTIRHVGGCLIDLTLVDQPNDQLGALFPASDRALKLATVLVDGQSATPSSSRPLRGRLVELVYATEPTTDVAAPALEIVYRLTSDAAGLEIASRWHNAGADAVPLNLVDAVRVDGEFVSGLTTTPPLFWAADDFWRQAYVIEAPGYRIELDPESILKKRPLVRYIAETSRTLAPGARRELLRRVYPGRHALEAVGAALRCAGAEVHDVTLRIEDADGAVPGATFRVLRGETLLGKGRSDDAGVCILPLPPGAYQAEVRHAARGSVDVALDVRGPATTTVRLPQAGYVEGQVTDHLGEPIPCKIEFVARGDQADPDFGPDSAEEGVRNLIYAADGRFRAAVLPGAYELLASHGPEYDAFVAPIEVAAGQSVTFSAALLRSVSTPGWVSAEYHSHSSPSGDNTSSQRGRVLNLLAEHLEFAPCTEHARIVTYDAHLAHFRSAHRMATCPGMELTGLPLPINHQNAFPLAHRPRTQNGGGPEADVNPEVQIERLAMWDEGSEKLVQSNHPNIPQMLGDRDLDGEADSGFAQMFSFMDVIEVHPPGAIFSPPEELPLAGRGNGNVIFHWLQLLNLGYRIPGVVNTDAHWNFHGSGWLRNYVRSSTDDPARIDVLEMVRNAEQGRLVMTNGPYLEAEATAEGGPTPQTAEIGDTLAAPQGRLQLRVRVQCANWLDVNRIQVFANGRPLEQANFTRRTHPELFSVDVVRFAHTLPLELEGDAHLIVAAAGEGLELGRVVGPDHAKTMPVAVSNPIFVDVDGDGFRANGDLLGLPLPRLPANAPGAAAGQ